MKDSPAASMMPAAMVAGQLVDEHTVATGSAQGQEAGLSVPAVPQLAAAYRDDDALSRA
jgi:hypothetical protein